MGMHCLWSASREPSDCAFLLRHFTGASSSSARIALPAMVSVVTMCSAYRSRNLLLSVDRIVALASLPSFHAMSTANPPRARKPLTLPVGQAFGSAGSNSISPAWLCSSISAMPAVPPKLPSIWNGGCERRRRPRRTLCPRPCSDAAIFARAAPPGRRRPAGPRSKSSRPSTSRSLRRRGLRAFSARLRPALACRAA